MAIFIRSTLILRRRFRVARGAERCSRFKPSAANSSVNKVIISRGCISGSHQHGTQVPSLSRWLSSKFMYRRFAFPSATLQFDLGCENKALDPPDYSYDQVSGTLELPRTECISSLAKTLDGTSTTDKRSECSGSRQKHLPLPIFHRHQLWSPRSELKRNGHIHRTCKCMSLDGRHIRMCWCLQKSTCWQSMTQQHPCSAGGKAP